MTGPRPRPSSGSHPCLRRQDGGRVDGPLTRRARGTCQSCRGYPRGAGTGTRRGIRLQRAGRLQAWCSRWAVVAFWAARARPASCRRRAQRRRLVGGLRRLLVMPAMGAGGRNPVPPPLAGEEDLPRAPLAVAGGRRPTTTTVALSATVWPSLSCVTRTRTAYPGRWHRCCSPRRRRSRRAPGSAWRTTCCRRPSRSGAVASGRVARGDRREGAEQPVGRRGWTRRRASPLGSSSKSSRTF